MDKTGRWQRSFKLILGQQRGLPLTIVPSPEEARRVIEENQPPVTDIIADGLYGRAFEVAELAEKHGLPIRVVSGSNAISQEAARRGIPFMHKRNMRWDKL